MMKTVFVAFGTSIALGMFSAPAAMADDLDDGFRIIQDIFTVHHPNRILVCDYDDDDDGGQRCYYVRRGHTIYRDYDDDDGHWHRYDDDDDDGGGWGDDDD